MFRTLRLPLLILFLSLVLLGGALFLRFGDEWFDSDPAPSNPPTATIAVQNPEASPETPPIMMATPVPTVQAVNNILAPVLGQLSEALVGNISKLNPLFVSFNPVDRDISALIFEGLTTTNIYGETVPDLAERWEVSRDGLEYIFLLRRDVLWHDGEPFTSEDVRVTINILRDPEFPGDPALRDFWRTVEMTIIDDYTIRFRLVQPLASFPEHLKIGVVPAHVLRDFPVAALARHPFNLDPIGTGPYQKETLFADNGQFAISLRVAPTYRMRPEGQNGYAIDRIVFRTYASIDQATAAFARGEVNSIGTVPSDRLSSFNALQNPAIYTRAMPAIGSLIYNWNREDIAYVSNQRARTAFALGIDRVGAVSRTIGAQVIPAESPLIPGGWAYEADVRFSPVNVGEAQQLLETISFEIEVEVEDTSEEVPSDEASDTEPPAEAPLDEESTGEAPPPVETERPTESRVLRRDLNLLVLDDALIIALAEDIAQQFATLGFTVTVEPASATDYIRRLEAGDFDMALVEYNYQPYADPDPYAFWHISQYENGINYGAIQDLRLSAILEEARRSHDGVIRDALYAQFQQLFVERAPALPLYHPIYAYVADQRLEGIRLGFISTPADRFRNIQEWRWSARVLQTDAAE